MFLAISATTRVNLNAVVDIEVQDELECITLHLVVPVDECDFFPGVEKHKGITSDFDSWIHITPEFPKYQALRNWIENNTL